MSTSSTASDQGQVSRHQPSTAATSLVGALFPALTRHEECPLPRQLEPIPKAPIVQIAPVAPGPDNFVAKFAKRLSSPDNFEVKFAGAAGYRNNFAFKLASPPNFGLKLAGVGSTNFSEPSNQAGGIGRFRLITTSGGGD